MILISTRRTKADRKVTLCRSLALSGKDVIERESDILDRKRGLKLSITVFSLISLLLRIYCLLACLLACMLYPCNLCNKHDLLVVVQVWKNDVGDLVPRNCYARATVLCNEQMARVSTINAGTISMAQILSDESLWQINYVPAYFIAAIKVPKPTAVNLNQINIK